ncbi:G-type lectin S-receptor-like serine/threonine-protein kinase SD2-5 [Prunus yedoensis var. nudiflora]|uniref:G-type lectin S-receptor-like serine/threonine-protein kinase SD2-5 n=1 Tax=Prunus yedoensis var. nudiflora TaxID=2094558 RepID=A0A314YL52_PRUYE|nr:G-type lectin S-receptor-like serine/threonine-protein kinase SD2-5 [Prunus yedoensis var. nudiflora]
MALFQLRTLCLCLLLFVFKTCIAGQQHKDRIYPGFQASQMDWSDNGGLFLLSNNSAFALGFYQSLDVKGSLLSNSDKFAFDKNGNAYLRSSKGLVWSTNTTGEVVSAMQLQDSGNLVLLGDKGSILWQSFSHPTDTLLPGQEFSERMNLKSFPKGNNVSHYLEIQSGELVLYAGYQTPQLYWSMADDSRKSNNNVSGKIHSLSLVSNSWNFYGANGSLLWQFVFSDNKDPNAFWAAVLGSDGIISFYNFQKGKSVAAEATKIPQSSCSTPEPCDPYYVCFFENWCECPSLLNSRFNCKPQALPTCNTSKSSVELLYVGEKLDYFALGFSTPSLKSNLSSCKEACLSDCSCLVLFFENSSGHCFLFDRVGSFERSAANSTGYISFMKALRDGVSPVKEGKGNKSKHILLLIVILVATILVIVGLVYVGFWYYRRMRLLEYSQEILEEDRFLDSLSGMPIRFTYGDLSRATKNFSNKIGQGGFGSVYLGVLPDGIQLASDVYSYGMVLLEIIGGKRNFDPGDSSAKGHFPSYAFKLLEEGNMKQFLDPNLDVDDNDERVVSAIKVALWCIQDEMQLRPPMTKVIQMLEGLCTLPPPPISPSMSGPRFSFLQWSSKDATSSSGLSNYNSEMSDVRLSGPR